MAGRKSSIATHPDRADIEAQIGAGVSDAAIARRYGISRSVVGRFRRAHASKGATPASDADALMAQLRGLYDQAAAFMKDAVEGKNTKEGLAAIKEARATLGLLAKAMGMLRDAAPVQVGLSVQVDANAPPGDAVQRALFRALDRHPEARAAVVEELKVLAEEWRPPEGQSDAV